MMRALRAFLLAAMAAGCMSERDAKAVSVDRCADRCVAACASAICAQDIDGRKFSLSSCAQMCQYASQDCWRGCHDLSREVVDRSISLP
jgi:hypothetical protein